MDDSFMGDHHGSGASTARTSETMAFNTNEYCKEKLLIGKAFVNGSDLLCPVSTTTAVAISEQPELRAYKLGKQKCSYNQVELLFRDVSGGKTSELKVSEAIETCVGAEVEEYLRESCLKFNVRFLNNMRMHLYIYIVYESAHLKISTASSPENIDVKQSCNKYYWMPVTRTKCRKGCTGPIIRGLQRFGRMSRRGAATQEGAEDSWKEPRHLYIAIDEASTHVSLSPENSKFRLLLAAYNDKYELLGTTISSSIRVLANNDAPLGAAFFKIHFNMKGACDEQSSHIQNQYFIRRDRMPLEDIAQNPSPPSLANTRREESTSLSAIVADVLSIKENYQDTKLKASSAQMLNQRGTGVCHRDDHSLNQLCERLFEECASKVGSIVTLRKLTSLLDTRKKRIFEIFNVLQCVQIVQKQGKETYTWLGSTRISHAISKLKEEAISSTSSCRARKFRFLSEEMVQNFMRELTEKFIQLFLVDEERPITLDFAVETILDKHNDPQTYRSKVRRLAEIARIFTALNLIVINNSDPDHGFSTGSLYSWRGVKGVQERLETAASRQLRVRKMHYSSKETRPAKRSSVRVKFREKSVKNSHDDMTNLPRLVSAESSDEDEIFSFCEENYNRPIKRPRLCATTTSYNIDNNILRGPNTFQELVPKSSDPRKFDGSASEIELAKRLSPVRCSEQEVNDNDPANYEAAAMLMSLSSDRYNPINTQQSLLSYRDKDEIRPKILEEPLALRELAASCTTEQFSTQYCLSILTQIRSGKSASVDDDTVVYRSEERFNPLDHLQRLFSPLQIAELQSKNPGFLFDYVRYSRQLYQSSYARNCVHIKRNMSLFNPVPLRAKMTIPSETNLVSGDVDDDMHLAVAVNVNYPPC